MSARRLTALAALAILLASPALAVVPIRVGELTTHVGDVPRRLVGYGLVVGLDGTGDRSFGGIRDATPSVRSVINMLRRFDVEVPDERLRLRNVAAVAVTAEVSPYLRAGGRFEVQVSALGDATSLRGGVLWITPLVTDPDQPPIATAQGPLYVATDERGGALAGRRVNSGRIASGGVLEVDPVAASLVPRLLLREPDLATATRIAAAINVAFGASTAIAPDPGSIALTAPANAAADLPGFLAAVDTVLLIAPAPARIVIDARQGTVVAGGGVRVGAAVVSHRGITLQIGGAPEPNRTNGFVQADPDASVEDVAAGLHAAGAKPEEIAAIFEALRSAGALQAEVVIR